MKVLQAVSTELPRWWLKLTPEKRQRYIDEHPGSQYAQHLDAPFLDDSGQEVDPQPPSNSLLNRLRRKLPMTEKQREKVHANIDSFTSNMPPKHLKKLMETMKQQHEDQKPGKEFKEAMLKVGGVLAGALAVALVLTPFPDAAMYLGGYASKQLTGKDIFDTGHFNEEDTKTKKLEFSDSDFSSPDSFREALNLRLKNVSDNMSEKELTRLRNLARGQQ